MSINSIGSKQLPNNTRQQVAQIEPENKRTIPIGSQMSSSAEELAIANSTNRKVGSKGKKPGSLDTSPKNKRIKALQAIQSTNGINLDAKILSQLRAKILDVVSSGGDLSEEIYTSDSYDSVLMFGSLTDLISDSEISKSDRNYLQEMRDALISKNSETIQSWVNTSKTVADNVSDNSLSVGLQRLLSVSSEKANSLMTILNELVNLGGAENSNELYDTYYKALVKDFESPVPSTDVSYLFDTLSRMSTLQSIGSMLQQSEAHLDSLKVRYELSGKTSQDYLQSILGLGSNLSVENVEISSARFLGFGESEKYAYIDSAVAMFRVLPARIWTNDDERIDSIAQLQNIRSQFVNPPPYEESVAKMKLTDIINRTVQ